MSVSVIVISGELCASDQTESSAACTPVFAQITVPHYGHHGESEQADEDAQQPGAEAVIGGVRVSSAERAVMTSTVDRTGGSSSSLMNVRFVAEPDPATARTTTLTPPAE